MGIAQSYQIRSGGAHNEENLSTEQKKTSENGRFQSENEDCGWPQSAGSSSCQRQRSFVSLRVT